MLIPFKYEEQFRGRTDEIWVEGPPLVASPSGRSCEKRRRVSLPLLLTRPLTPQLSEAVDERLVSLVLRFCLQLSDAGRWYYLSMRAK